MRCRKSADARSPMCNPPNEIRTFHCGNRPFNERVQLSEKKGTKDPKKHRLQLDFKAYSKAAIVGSS
jgi:hypothetical protein